MGLFKSKEEKAAIKYDKGSDLIAQKQFDNALYNFKRIIEMGQATPEVYVLKQLLEMRKSYTSVRSLQDGINCFSKYPGLMVKYGVYDVNVDDLLRECEIRIRGQLALASNADKKERGMELIRAATEIVAYNKPFILDQIFAEKVISGTDYANMLFAFGYEDMSEAVKWENPKKAAEYQQQAMFYNKERHDTVAVGRNEAFIRDASMTVHCWFCGKEVSGANIHFVRMPCDLTNPVLTQANPDDVIPTNDSDCVYACIACFTAFDNLGKAYYEKAREYTDQEVERVRRQLMAEIEALRAQMGALMFRR